MVYTIDYYLKAPGDYSSIEKAVVELDEDFWRGITSTIIINSPKSRKEVISHIWKKLKADDKLMVRDSRGISHRGLDPDEKAKLVEKLGR